MSRRRVSWPLSAPVVQTRSRWSASSPASTPSRSRSRAESGTATGPGARSPAAGRGAGWYSSTTRCALVPLWPMELTAASRGAPGTAGHGLPTASMVIPEPSSLIMGLRVRKVGIPGKRSLRMLSSTFTRPIAPAAAPVWPTFALALPSTHPSGFGCCLLNARASAPASTGSPSTVPVPCAST